VPKQGTLYIKVRYEKYQNYDGRFVLFLRLRSWPCTSA
jgi:hypothetical protein